MARIAPGVDLFDLQPEVRNALLTAQAELDKAGIDSTVTSAARTRGAQEQLYNAYLARGRTGLPAAPPGSSKHETGQAVDFSIPEQQRDTANAILAKHGFQWFGPGDRVHYTYGGPSQRSLLDAFSGAPAPTPQKDLLSAFSAPAAPRPKQPKPQKDLLAAFSPQPAAARPDLLAAFGGAAPAPVMPQLGTPGNPRRSGAAPPPDVAALSYPRHVTTGGNAPLQTTPAMMAQERAQPGQQASAANIGLAAGTLARGMQRPLNVINTPITLGSAYFNNVVREVGKQHAAGKPEAALAPFMADIPAYIEAARRTPWAKLLVQSLKGNYAEFPEPLHAFAQGAPQSAAGKLIQKHPLISGGLDLAISFPITAAMGEAQNMLAGKLGQGLRATGAGEQILNRLPKVRQFLENQDIHQAATELINKSQAGMQHYLDDAAKAAEDARVTSQKYLQQGVKLGYKSEHTGQPVNRLEELVADYMDAGNPGSKYEGLHPAPEVVARDRAVADRLHAILQQARTARAAVDAGAADANALLDRLLQSARTAGREAVQSAVAAEPASVEAAAAERARSVLGRVRQQARTAGREIVSRAAPPVIGSRWRLPDGSTLEVMDRTAIEAAGGSLQPGDLPLLVVDPGRSGFSAGQHLAASSDALLREGSQIPVAGESAALSLRGESDWSQSAREMLAEANAPLPGLPAEAPLTNARAIKAKIDAIEAKAREALQGIVNRSRSAAVSGYTDQKAAQALAAGELASERGPLGTILQRARETGPGVIRAQAYNDLARSAEQANRGAQRARELGTVAEDAASIGIDFADVQRIGDQWSRIFDNLGKHLVDTGLVDADAWARLKGQYLPRLYLLTKGNPGDIDAFLGFLEKEGALTREAVLEAQQRGLTTQWGKQGMYGRSSIGPRGFTQSRELTDFGERNVSEVARAMVPEATPAALHGIEAQARSAGLARGMEEIAKNPEWAKPLDQATAEQLRQGWVPYQGKGPLSGMAIHPAIRATLEAAKNPNAGRELLTSLLGPKWGNYVHQGNQIIRKAMLGGPSTIANVVIGHYYFAASEASIAGAHFTPIDYALAARDMRAMARGEKYDHFLSEAMNQTDLLAQGSGILPKEAKRVSGGVGLETPAQNFRRGAAAGLKKYLSTTHDALAAGKFGLYRQLRRKGYGINDAARMTRQATINYSGLPRAIRVLDQGMIAPFITFTYRAIPLAGRMAVRRPDIFATASGHRFTYYLDRMADRLAESKGQKPDAVARRQQGLLAPTTFAIPGVTEHGKQKYEHIPLAAPLLHHFQSGADITDVAQQPFRAVNPLPTAITSAILNRDVRGHEVRPIIPAGLPQGVTAEKFGIVGSYLLHALAPPIGKLELFQRAATGTTSYPRAGLRPQTMGEAALQYFTGSHGGTATELLHSGEIPTSQQKAVREEQRAEGLAQERRAGGVHFGTFAMGYFQRLMAEHSRNPSYSPEPSYQQKADALSPGDFRTTLDAARLALQNVVYGEHWTGKDRQAAIRRLIDWNYSLAVSAQKRGMRAAPVFRGLGQGIGRPLAQMR